MLKGLIFFIKFSWKNRKSYLILNIINQIFFGVLPLIIITLPKYIIDELMSGQRIDRILLIEQHETEFEHIIIEKNDSSQHGSSGKSNHRLI